MNKKLISIIIGTRPEAIKLAPIVIEFRKIKKFNTRVILTGQHIEMVKQVIDLFNINTDINLNIMREKQSLKDLTCNILDGLTNEFKLNKPALVIIQGDTTTAFAAALAAFYNKIPVGHVEAGLRTNNIYDPFPEEANRRLISQIATLHFAPTKNSLNNLKISGIKENIFITGNTVIDSLLFISRKKKGTRFLNNIKSDNKRIILTTIHRRENWGKNIQNILKAIKEILVYYPDVYIIIPLHKNKIVRDPIKKFLGKNDRVNLCEPLDYEELIEVMKFCTFILTDSGGIQEEAPSLKKPVLVLRNTTEREEAIMAGTAKLIGTKTENIVREIKNLLDDKEYYNSMISKKNPFGDGDASIRILEKCMNYLSKN